MGSLLTNLLKGVLRTRRSPPRPAANEERVVSGAQPILAAQQAAAEGRLSEARTILEGLTDSGEHALDAQIGLGNVHFLAGEPVAAEQAYRSALELDPHHAAAHSNLGFLLRKLQRNEEAATAFREAVAAAPDMRVAWRGLIEELATLGRQEQAEVAVIEAISKAGESGEVLAARGLLNLLRNRNQAAAQDLQRAVELGIREPDVYSNLGIAYQHLGRLEEALQSYDGSLALDSANARARSLRLVTEGIAHRNAGERSDSYFEQAVNADPTNYAARFYRSLSLLLREQFSQAWPDYEARLHQPDGRRGGYRFPEWSSEPLSGKTLLVLGEQGLGDEIMFASCIPDVLALGARCIVDCDPRLAALFSRSFPQARVHGGKRSEGTEWLADVGHIDYQAHAGSLPLRFRRTRHEFPAHHGYLHADPARIAHWKSRLDALGAGIKVGLSWRGGSDKSGRSRRSLELKQLASLLAVDRAQFVSLQYDLTEAELAVLSRDHRNLVHFHEAIMDYNETAALVAALDVVVSVCTAVTHLGGALGKPVLVMAPDVPEWRYGISSARMAWYPSVQVIRQSSAGDWGPVIDLVVDTVAELARHGTAKPS